MWASTEELRESMATLRGDLQVLKDLTAQRFEATDKRIYGALDKISLSGQVPKDVLERLESVERRLAGLHAMLVEKSEVTGKERLTKFGKGVSKFYGK